MAFRWRRVVRGEGERKSNVWSLFSIVGTSLLEEGREFESRIAVMGFGGWSFAVAIGLVACWSCPVWRPYLEGALRRQLACR